MATIKKNQTAEIPTKSGSKYSYQYVDIAQIHEYLEENNMSYYQFIDRIDNDDYIMTVKIDAEGNESKPLRGSRVVDATLFGNDNPAQKQGSALTYARRYSLLMAFGLATEDDDAQSLSKEIEVTKEYAENYVFNFGKHKGKRLMDLIDKEDSYIDWLLKNENTSPDLIKSIEILTGQVPKEVDLELTQTLQRAIVDYNLDVEKLCTFYKVKKITDLTKEQIEDVLKRTVDKK